MVWEAFYQKLRRVLMNKGELFHHTGNPYTARRGTTFPASIARRLPSAKFKKVLVKPHLRGDKAVTGPGLVTIDEISEVHKARAGGFDFCNLQGVRGTDNIEVFTERSGRQVSRI